MSQDGSIQSISADRLPAKAAQAQGIPRLSGTSLETHSSSWPRAVVCYLEIHFGRSQTSGPAWGLGVEGPCQLKGPPFRNFLPLVVRILNQQRLGMGEETVIASDQGCNTGTHSWPDFCQGARPVQSPGKAPESVQLRHLDRRRTIQHWAWGCKPSPSAMAPCLC